MTDLQLTVPAFDATSRFMGEAEYEKLCMARTGRQDAAAQTF